MTAICLTIRKSEPINFYLSVGSLPTFCGGKEIGSCRIQFGSFAEWHGPVAKISTSSHDLAVPKIIKAAARGWLGRTALFYMYDQKTGPLNKLVLKHLEHGQRIRLGRKWFKVEKRENFTNPNSRHKCVMVTLLREDSFGIEPTK